jgi:hypothetical protein
VAQLAEADPLKGSQCRFEPDRGYAAGCPERCDSAAALAAEGALLTRGAVCAVNLGRIAFLGGRLRVGVVGALALHGFPELAFDVVFLLCHVGKTVI